MDRAELDEVVNLTKRANEELASALKALRLELVHIDTNLRKEITAAKGRAKTDRDAVLEQIAMLQDPGPCS